MHEVLGCRGDLSPLHPQCIQGGYPRLEGCPVRHGEAEVIKPAPSLAEWTLRRWISVGDEGDNDPTPGHHVFETVRFGPLGLDEPQNF